MEYNSTIKQQIVPYNAIDTQVATQDPETGHDSALGAGKAPGSRLAGGTLPLAEPEVLARELRGLKDELAAQESQLTNVQEGKTENAEGLAAKVETLKRQIADKEGAIQAVGQAHSLGDLRSPEGLLEEDTQLDRELLALHDDVKRERKSKLRSMHQSQGSQVHDQDNFNDSSPGVGDHQEGLEAALGSASGGAKDSIGEERTQRAGSVPGDTDVVDVNTNYGNLEGEFASNSVHLGSGKCSRNLPGELGALQSACAQTSQRSPREMPSSHPYEGIPGKCTYDDYGNAQELQVQQVNSLLISGQRASLSPPNKAKHAALPRGTIKVNLKRRPQAEDAAVGVLIDPMADTIIPQIQHPERSSFTRAETSAFNSRPGFKGSRRHTRPKQLNLQLETFHNISPGTQRQAGTQGETVRNHTPRQQNVKPHQVLFKKFHVLVPTQYNTAAILADNLKDASARHAHANSRAQAVASKTAGVVCGQTLQYSTALPVNAPELDHSAFPGANAHGIEPLIVGMRDLKDESNQHSSADFRESQKAVLFAKNQDIGNVTNDDNSRESVPSSAGKKDRIARMELQGSDLFKMTRNETEGGKPAGSSSLASDNPSSPAPLQPGLNQRIAVGAAQSRAPNLELKTIFSHKIDIKHTKNTVNQFRKNALNIEKGYGDPGTQQASTLPRPALKSQGAPSSISKNYARNKHLRPSNMGAPSSSPRPAIVLIDKSRVGHDESMRSKNSKLSNIMSNQNYSSDQHNPIRERNERNTTLPNLVTGAQSSSKEDSTPNLPQILTSNGAVRTMHKRSKKRMTDKANYIGSFVEMPMQYNNAFHNSFYNTQLEKVMQFSRASRGSKRSLLFSPKASAEEHPGSSARGGTSGGDVNANEGVTLRANDARVKILLQEQQLITESKIKIRSTSQSKQKDPGHIEIEEGAGQKPLLSIANKYDKYNIGLSEDADHLPDSVAHHIPSLSTEECFEQQDQILTNKLNHYYKQLKSREKDQSIVISHPYDLSHLAVTQKCFLTSNILKHKQNMPMEYLKTNQVRTARPGAQRHYFQHPKSYRVAQTNADATPRQRKEEWIRKAAEGKEQQLLIHQRPNQHQRIKSLFDYAQNQKYTLQAGGAKIFDKSQQAQSRQSPRPSASRSSKTGQFRDAPANMTLPSRNTPTMRQETQGVAYIERRDGVNVQQTKLPSAAPLQNSLYLMNFRNDDQSNMKRPSVGLGSSDATQTSRIQRGSQNGPIQEPRSAQRADEASISAGRQSPMYCVIATDRTNPDAAKRLQPDDKFLRGGASAHFQDSGANSYSLVNDEAASPVSCPGARGNAQSPKRGMHRLGDAAGNFSFRNVARPYHGEKQQTIVLQNQREQQFEGIGNQTMRTMDKERQVEYLAQSSIQSYQQKNRLVAYSSLGSTTKADQPYPRASNQEDQEFGGIAEGRQSHQNDTSQTPRYMPNQSNDSSPAHSTSVNAALPQPSVFFATDHGSSTQQTHLHSIDSRPKKENCGNAGMNNSKNEVQAQQLSLMNAGQIGNAGFGGPGKMMRLDHHLQQLQDTKNSTLSQSPRLSSPGSTSYSPRRQSDKRQTLGRKQVGGYAGGVIGSGVDASLYHTGQASQRKRPFTKQVRGEKKVILYSHLEAVPTAHGTKDQKAMTIENNLGQVRKATDRRDIESQEQAQQRRIMYETLGLRGLRLSEQREFDQDEMTLRNQSVPIDGNGIKKIQLTQRNNQLSLSPQEASMISVIGQNHDMRVSNKVASTGPGTSTSPIPNTSRSFKMDDILGEPNQNSTSNHRASPANQERPPANRLQKEERFRPLNMKEIQMQISQEEYAHLMKERKCRETDAVKKRSNNPLSAQAKGKTYQSRQPTRRERSREAQAREDDLLQEEQSDEKPLDPWIIEFLRQKTLYKMQRDLWKVYEAEWQKFARANHLTARAPIPPNCRILTLHVYLNETKRSISNIKTTTQLPIDIAAFSECHKEAKRRLQMCSFRIIDENVFIEMKNEMNEGFQVMLSGDKQEMLDGRRQIPGQNYLIVEHSGDPRSELSGRDPSPSQAGGPTLLQALRDGAEACSAEDERSETALTK